MAGPPAVSDDYNRHTPAHGDTVQPVCTLSVVSHGQGALVERLLADLARLRPASLELVIVTRNLPEPPIAVPQDFAVPLRVIDNSHPKGFGANHNAAFGNCSSDWFVIVNPDIRLPTDPFPALFAAPRPGDGLVAPQVIEPDGGVADSARALPTPAQLAGRIAARALGRAAAPAVRAEWYAGMFLAVRHRAYAEVGGFDEGFHLYCEDVDLCARLRLAGWGLAFAPQASVVHAARRASRGSPRHLGWHLASIARLWRSATYRSYRALLARERAATTRPDRG